MKKKIIIISIIAFLVILIAVLFGAVFRLKNQNVIKIGETTATNEQILYSAGFETGSSIFFLDKESATQKIEKDIPTIKVVQIKTVGFRSIEIIVRERQKTYYAQVNDNYYLMDEDLKVLEITTDLETAKNYIKINDTTEEKILNIDENTQVADFVGGDNQEIFYNLYTSIYRTATKQVDGQKQYLTRGEVIDFVESVNIEHGNTLNENYKRLIVKTASGVVFDISKPNENLLDKINMCLSAYESGEYDTTKGTVKIFYHADGTEDFDYFG